MEKYTFHTLSGQPSISVLAKNASEARAAKNRILSLRKAYKAAIISGKDRFPCDDEQGDIVFQPSQMYQ